MKIIFKNEKEEKLSLSSFHETILKMLALINKDRDYQELSVEDTQLAVAGIDSSLKVKGINFMQAKFEMRKLIDCLIGENK